ncbi:MAG: dipeptidyl-peptidase 3 family protein, partial [Woeseiaceae bacterium]
MNATWRRFGALLLLAGTVAACNGRETGDMGNTGNEAADASPAAVEPPAEVVPRPEIYANFALTADLSGFSEQQRQMLVLLIEASNVMDDLFWRQAFRDDYAGWLASIGVAETRRFAELNYGPWDRLDDEKPFMDGFGAKPLGANLYPADITTEEFEAAPLEGKRGLYSLIRRNEAGDLTVVPYHVAFEAELERAASLLRDA